MTPEEMQAKSSEKVKQIMALMKVLNIRVEARERISAEGFIEKIVFWIDEEKYPAAPAEVADTAADKPASPEPEAQPEAESEAESEEAGPVVDHTSEQAPIDPIAE